jgi:hypothetical protein
MPPLTGKSAKIGNGGHEWTLNNFGQRATGNGQRAHGLMDIEQFWTTGIG